MKSDPEWKEIHARRWKRSDGAVVKWEIDSPHPNPENPRCRLWTCYEPDPSERRVCKKVGRWRRDQSGKAFRLGVPRRFKSPESAMKWMDKNYPQK